MNYSPLRYPGGKNRLAPFIAKICVDNSINGHYIEPYSGGAAVALFLLFEGFVNQITINDNDRSIYAFWHSVLNNTDIFCKMIADTPVTIEEWKKQKEIQRNKNNVDLLELGYSTFFLNRTNRSGVIKGGVIGGYEQLGNYKLDCRFNKKNLIGRIEQIAKQRNRILLYDEDALDLVDHILANYPNRDNLLFYFDPPYYVKGQSLYMNYYQKKHHEIVSEKIKSLQNVNWIVSYDDADEIKNLYCDCKMIDYTINYSTSTYRKGKELIYFSPTIKIDSETDPLYYKFKKNKKVLYTIMSRNKSSNI